jgi:hypothetical protein
MTRAQTAINKFLQRKGKGEGRWMHTLGRWWKRKRSTKNSLGKDVDPEQSAEVLGAPPPLPGVDAPYIWREKRSGIYRREEEDAPRFLAPPFPPRFSPTFSFLFGRKRLLVNGCPPPLEYFDLVVLRQ